MRLFLISFALFAALFPVLAEPLPTYAQGTKELLEGQLKEAGETGAGFAAAQSQNPLAIVTQVIKVLLSLLGVIFLVLMIYGGVVWMTAMGNEQKVDKAKGIIKTGVIGLIIVIGSYTISVTVLSWLLRATGQPAASYTL